MAESVHYLSIQEEQKEVLKITKAIHAYCEKHGLRYVLCFGTLLGAVRHKGFIPWDNDMDIEMPRKDLERLVELTKQEPIAPEIRLFDLTTDQNFHYPIVRACNIKTLSKPSYLREPIESMGIWVDIFPLDGVNRIKYPIQRPVVWILMTLLNATVYRLPPEAKTKRFLQKIILKVFPNKNHRFERWLSAICKWSPYDRSEKVWVLCDRPRWPMKKEIIEQPILAPFEDTELNIPQEPEKWLQIQYGDYMKLPPEENRIPHLTTSQYL